MWSRNQVTSLILNTLLNKKKLVGCQWVRLTASASSWLPHPVDQDTSQIWSSALLLLNNIPKQRVKHPVCSSMQIMQVFHRFVVQKHLLKCEKVYEREEHIKDLLWHFVLSGPAESTSRWKPCTSNTTCQTHSRVLTKLLISNPLILSDSSFSMYFSINLVWGWYCSKHLTMKEMHRVWINKSWTYVFSEYFSVNELVLVLILKMVVVLFHELALHFSELGICTNTSWQCNPVINLIRPLLGVFMFLLSQSHHFCHLVMSFKYCVWSPKVQESFRRAEIWIVQWPQFSNE